MSTREAFEKWAASQGYKIGRMEIGAYWSFDTSSAWLAWQAATERADASCASMCEKMVAAEREACAKVCDAERQDFGGVAAGPMTTDAGKRVHEAMAAGAATCAAAIRARGQKEGA